MSNAAPKSAAMIVLRRLRKAGFQALFAGGCVRDMLLGLRCSDYDIATDATPDDVRKLFPHVLLVGTKFGVAMVVFDKRKVEVTTFRTDLSYQDGRRPTGVKFSSPKEDAQRRDFTINGMFFDPVANEVIDYVGGREDLAAKVLRTIGSADERFGEDYLRMIRAVRFAVRLGFAIDPDTAAGIARFAPRITSISGERIYEELTKMLARPSAAEALRKLEEFKLAEAILPEMFGRSMGVSPMSSTGILPMSSTGILPVNDAGVSPALGENRGQAPFSQRQQREKGASPHFRWAVERVEAVAEFGDVVLALAAMLCELPVRQIHAITRRWGASNEVREGLSWMAEHWNDWHTAAGVHPQAERSPLEGGTQTMPLHQFKRLMAHVEFPRLRRLWRVAEQTETHSHAQSRAIDRRVASIDPKQIAPPPFVTGDDLKAMGLHEGPALGKIVRALYDAQLDELRTDRAAAMDAARRMIADDAKRQA